MSIAKIHAFTTWVNFRLELDNTNRLHNVLTDLFKDFHWQHLIARFTGSKLDNIGTFTGITQIQKTTRIEWIIKELISWKLINEETKLNAKLIAARNSGETLSLLQKLIHQDVQFLWLRMEFLQLDDCKQISQYEFKIFPEKLASAKPKKFKVKKDLFKGFGLASETYTEIIDENEPPFVRQRIFANDSEILAQARYTSAKQQSIPKPINCLLSIIRNHLKMSKSGKRIKINNLNELCNVRILCLFFNVLIPDSFSSEILPNDRWSINLVLKTLEKILKIESDFEAADLNSNEESAIMAYFTTILLALYRFRQCMKVLEYQDDLKYKIRFVNLSQEISLSENEAGSTSFAQQDKSQMNEALYELEELKERFDIKFCQSWKNHCKKVLNEAVDCLRKKINYQFEIMQVPQNMSVADLCIKNFICTKNQSCCGYYQIKTKEIVNDDRKIILRNLKNDKIIFDHETQRKSKVRLSLKVSQVGHVNCDPEKMDAYEIYLDSYSKNKCLSADEKFLYQLFPIAKYYWKNMLLKSGSNNDVTTIQALAKIFKNDKNFINYQEPETGNTALHLAVINGHMDSVLCLLDNGADVDAKNRYKMSALFRAVENEDVKMCGILLEWGANIHLINNRNMTVLDLCKQNSLKTYIENQYQFYLDLSQSVLNGNPTFLHQVIHDHRTKHGSKLINLRSRCIQGSTLLHSAAHFSNLKAIKELLLLKVDVNQLDYKGATALHRASDLEIINHLIEAGADVNLLDEDGNQPLHAACYIDENGKNPMDKVIALINNESDLLQRNIQLLLPIHCAAMQGRCNVIEKLLEHDSSNLIIQELENDKLNPNPPSINFLALFGGFLDCVQWLQDRGFHFKDNEPNQLLKSIITGELVLHGSALNKAVNLLIYKTGADVNKRYPPLSQSALHLAAYLPDSTDLLTLLIEAGADVNSTDIEHCTPLFISCRVSPTEIYTIYKIGKKSLHLTLRNTAMDIVIC